jgi:hypothetical protein
MNLTAWSHAGNGKACRPHAMGSVVSTPTPEAVSNVLLQACDAVLSASPYRLFFSRRACISTP